MQLYYRNNKIRWHFVKCKIHPHCRIVHTKLAQKRLPKALKSVCNRTFVVRGKCVTRDGPSFNMSFEKEIHFK